MKKDEFLEALLTLRPYLNQLVIVGGWAAYIYHKHYTPNPPQLEPLGTMDIDFATRRQIPVVQNSTIDELLVAAGYQRELGPSYTSPPATKYVLSPDKDFEIEFITNLKGNETEVTQDIQNGLGAQKLRYVDILMDNTIGVKVVGKSSDGQEINVIAQVAHPGRFVFQKIMASADSRRDRVKANKDIYYAYDLITNYPDLYNSIVSEIQNLKTEVPAAWHKRFIRILSGLYSSPDADGPSRLLSQRPGTSPSGDVFRQLAYQKMSKFIEDVK